MSCVATQGNRLLNKFTVFITNHYTIMHLPGTPPPPPVRAMPGLGGDLTIFDRRDVFR